MRNLKLTFEQWKVLVNALVEGRYGLSCDDLPDVDYRQMYDANLSTQEAARKAIANARNV